MEQLCYYLDPVNYRNNFNNLDNYDTIGN